MVRDKKNIKITIVILSAFIVSVTLFVALYCNPVMYYTISKPVNVKSNNYCELPVLTYGTRFDLPLPSKSKQIISDFNNKRIRIYKDIMDNYDSPRHIKVEVIKKEKSTEFLFVGTVTKEGKEIEYNNGFSIEKSLSEKIAA